MKKNLLTTLVGLLCYLASYAQADWNTNGNSTTNPLSNYVGTQDAADLNFATDYTAQSLFMMRLTTAGWLGLGTTAPTSLFHMHQAASSTATDFQMTNNVTGNTANDGFITDVDTKEVVNFRQQEDTSMNFYTGNSNPGEIDLRMTISHDSLGDSIVTRVGIVENGRSWTRFNRRAPVSLLQLGEGATANTQGHRSWMDVGTYTTGGTDYTYFGLKNEENFPAELWTDHMDAVIGWGDNRDSVRDNLNDLRFILTVPYNPGSNDSAARFNGLEMMRIGSNGHVGVGNFYNPATPFANIRPARKFEVMDSLNAPQVRITQKQSVVYTDLQTTSKGDLYIHPDSANTDRRVGIQTATPGNTLEILSGTTGNSGLRFSNLTSAFTPTYTSIGKVLTVNLNGDVVLTDDQGGTGITMAQNGLTIYPSFPNVVELGGTLTKNTTIAQNSYDLKFTGTGSSAFTFKDNGTLINTNNAGTSGASWFATDIFSSGSGTTQIGEKREMYSNTSGLAIGYKGEPYNSSSSGSLIGVSS